MSARQGKFAAATVATAGMVLVAAVFAGNARAEVPVDITDLCVAAAAKQERALHIPDALLQALALAESGRRDEETRRLVTWPWTVMAEGEGNFYPSKSDAVAAVEKLRARGVRNIDVGCMQINLLHHADAFESIEDALDPDTNVRYGARYLAALQRETGSWFTAIKRYHSAAPKFHLPYRTRVFQIWRNAKRQLLAGVDKPATAADEASEAMSATITFTPLNLAALPIATSPESRESRWQSAFKRTESALSEWRRSSVSIHAVRQEHQAGVADQARRAMQVLDRAGKR